MLRGRSSERSAHRVYTRGGENIGQGSGHRVVGHKAYVISVDGTGGALLASEGCEPVWLP